MDTQYQLPIKQNWNVMFYFQNHNDKKTIMIPVKSLFPLFTEKLNLLSTESIIEMKQVNFTRSNELLQIMNEQFSFV